MLFVKKNSAEADILQFVAKFCGLSEYEICENDSEQIWCEKPVMKIGKNDFVASLPSILRHIAKSNGFRNLLGTKGAVMKTPAEFSSRTRLIQEYLTQYNTDISKVIRGVEDLEQILAGPIVQHNLDKYQRLLLKEEQELNRKRNSDGELQSNRIRKRKKGKKYQDSWNIVQKAELPELENAFVDGIQLTITDLAAFIPVQRVIENLGSEAFRERFPIVNLWFGRCMRIISKRIDLDKFQFEIPAIVLEEKEADKDFRVITRRHSNKKSVPVFEKDEVSQRSDSHSKSSKSMIQKLELSAKVDLETVRNKLPKPEPYSHVETQERDQIILDGFSDPETGGLGKDRTVRKILQLQNMVACLAKMDTKGKVIVDFCAGGGHLGFAAAKVCPEATVVLIETNEESLNRARVRIDKWNVDNVVICQSNMTQLNCKFDIGLAVHACGSATDQVIQMCLDKNAAFVVSPCCYGRVSDLVLPRSKEYQKKISAQESLLLAHAADITPVDEALTKTGKECMNLTDTDRKLKCEEYGYEVTIYEMIPLSCSPKNNFIVAEPRTNNQ